MEHTSAEDIKKHVRTYILVFVALLVLTIVTVGVSYLHLSIVPAVILALLIASVKGALVASYFMHLISEKKLVYFTLILTVVFLITLLSLPLLGFHDTIQ
ncbi:MAG: cytochrome C oxidase subunit IV family protein [Bacteroidota bacterium]